VEELAKEYEGRISFAKMDVDQNPKMAKKYGVMSIPTLIIFKNGAPISNIVGVRPKAELKKGLDAVLK
jgi:thioredoxin 1